MNNFQAGQETIGEQNAGTIDDVDVAPAVIPEQSEPVSVKSPRYRCAWCGEAVVDCPARICKTCETAKEWRHKCQTCESFFTTSDPEQHFCSSFCADSVEDTRSPYDQFKYVFDPSTDT